MERIVLSPRLEAIAQMVGTCRLLADVGTDHAFLPAALLQRGWCGSAFACDVNEGPLLRAKRTVECAGCADRVRLILSDGLTNVPAEYDVLVIAGMGGDLISSILSAFPPDPSVRLFFQPMTKPAVLREFLAQNGYTLLREQGVREGTKAYGIMEARRIPDPCPGDPELPRNLQPGSGAVAYLDKLLAAHRRRLSGLAAASVPDGIAMERERQLIAQLTCLREEKRK